MQSFPNIVISLTVNMACVQTTGCEIAWQGQ